MTELTNPRSDRVKAVRSLAGRSARTRHSQYLVEGPQSVREIVRFAPELIRDLYYTQPSADRYPELVAEAVAAGVYVHSCSEEVMRTMSEDAQGLLVVAQMREVELTHIDFSAVKNVAILCEVRDPGNAGTIIRAADAAGADLVVLTQGCVDLYNPKVLRSTVGSLYHLPVVTGLSISDVAAVLTSHDIQMFAASGEGDFDLDDLQDAVDRVPEVDGSPKSLPSMVSPTAWLFGNEARGLSEEEFSLADHSVRVPLRGKAESLNVATAATVCLYATSRAQRQR